jgi:hypothetical protein
MTKSHDFQLELHLGIMNRDFKIVKIFDLKKFDLKKIFFISKNVQ